MNEVLRQEKKYLLAMEEYVRLSYYFSQILSQDKHNGVNGYCIRSLYFDSIDNEDYYDKINGIEIRKKIRLRIYNTENDFAMLEMKQKQGMYQRKRSLKVNREDAILITKGIYSPLLTYNTPFALECYGIMNQYCYRPKTIIEYNRKAFIAKENKIRITFDSKINALEGCSDLFSNKIMPHPVLKEYFTVLEVKYNRFLPSYIKDVIKNCNKSEESVSKYCLGRYL